MRVWRQGPKCRRPGGGGESGGRGGGDGGGEGGGVVGGRDVLSTYTARCSATTTSGRSPHLLSAMEERVEGAVGARRGGATGNEKKGERAPAPRKLTPGGCTATSTASARALASVAQLASLQKAEANTAACCSHSSTRRPRDERRDSDGWWTPDDDDKEVEDRDESVEDRGVERTGAARP